MIPEIGIRTNSLIKTELSSSYEEKNKEKIRAKKMMLETFLLWQSYRLLVIPLLCDRELLIKFEIYVNIFW